MKKVNKRPILLLEVLIALTLVLLCIFPLLFPYLEVAREHRRFVRLADLDHLVNTLYSELIEKLYLNQIDLSVVLGQQSIPIEDPRLKALQFKGSYRFDEIKTKPDKEGPHMVFMRSLIYEMAPFDKKEGEAPLKYTYVLVIELDRIPHVNEITVEKKPKQIKKEKAKE